MFTVNWTVQNYDAFKGFLPALEPDQGRRGRRWARPNTPEGLKKIDDSTVEMTLAAPNAAFLYSITDMANVILPEHILKDVTKADVETIDFTVGTPGATDRHRAVQARRFTADQSVELEAYPDYFKGAPEDRQQSSSSSSPTRRWPSPSSSPATSTSHSASRPVSSIGLSAIDTLNVISADNPGIVRIVFKTEAAPWSDKRVRQAFYTAINRQAIVDDFYKGRAKVL